MKLDTDVLYYALGFCGCTDDEVTTDFQKVFDCLLEAKKNDGSIYYDAIAEKTKLTSPHVQLILLLLDKIGLTEHGTAIRGSWLAYKWEERWKALCGVHMESVVD